MRYEERGSESPTMPRMPETDIMGRFGMVVMICFPFIRGKSIHQGHLEK